MKAIFIASSAIQVETDGLSSAPGLVTGPVAPEVAVMSGVAAEDFAALRAYSTFRLVGEVIKTD